jgi:hypothetical protein
MFGSYAFPRTYQSAVPQLGVTDPMDSRLESVLVLYWMLITLYEKTSKHNKPNNLIVLISTRRPNHQKRQMFPAAEMAWRQVLEELAVAPVVAIVGLGPPETMLRASLL